MLTDHDIYLFREGSHTRLYEKLGCHLHASGEGGHFAVWAPNAREVSVIGEWNGWRDADRLAPRWDSSGIWEGEVSGVRRGSVYKFRIVSNVGNRTFDKADPFALCTEVPPAGGSRAWTLDYDWGDAEWMAQRARRNALDAPMSIYEVHAGSW
ncbi:MAG TPA: 1,4-alpha-glucan branching enzyme, partial [Burkholderiales bacterium]|nr:1,4-alpha-glucan branching enzyme [Burkholderiales bacterium]